MPGHLSAAEAPEDLWTCHECGWTYPNHHPSAKHRRNHKKVCGSIPGFIGTISSRKAPPEQTAPSIIVDRGSSDDDSSDDETTPNKTHERGHHHQKVAAAQEQQSVAGSAGNRNAKTLCASHRSKEQCLNAEVAVNMKPAPLTERSFLDQNNRQALQSTASAPNTPVKPQHVRRRSAHALEGVWVCRHCAWTYPNAHPSAKHRRKHKKKCPALVVTPRHVVGAGGSSDDASSDEEIKRGGALGKQEALETNVSSIPSSLPTALEAFLGRSDSKRELRELQDTIILLSPKPVSRRNSFKSPRHRREGPSGFLSPRGGVMKASKAVNNNQAQELVLTAIEKKPEAVSDQENEDPVVLNLPAVRLVTNSPSAPAAELETEGGDTLERRRSSSSDESDLVNSDGEAPSSPDSVLQPVHLLLPITTSTTTEDTRISSDNHEVTDEEVTQQPLHQSAAAAAMKLDEETERDESTNEAVADKQKQHEAVTTPLLPPLICEVSPEDDTSASNPSEAADRKDSQEVSSANSCQPVDASPCAELQTAETGPICVPKETAEKAILSGWKYLASSLVVNAAVESTIGAHVEASVLDSDIAAEHLSVGTGLLVGGPSDREASIGSEHHGGQEGKARNLELDREDRLHATDVNSDKSGSENASTEAATKEDKEKDSRSLNSVVLSEDVDAAEIVKEEECKDSEAQHSRVIETVETVKGADLPVVSSEVPSAYQSLVDISEVVAEEENHLAPCESLQENTNILLDALNAAEVQPPSINTLELSSETAILPTETQSSTSPPPDTVTEDDSSSEPSAPEKVQEEALDDATIPPSTATGNPDLSSVTLPTPKSQVVVTGPVGDEDQEVNKYDETESQETHVVEEKTTSSVAINSHLSVRKAEGPEASFYSGAAEERSKEIQRSGVAEESSKDNVSNNVGDCQTEGEIASKGAEQQQSSSHPEASTKLTSSTNSVTEDQVGIDELNYVNNGVERKEVSPAFVEELCDVNTTKNQVPELDHEIVTTDEGRTEVVEPSAIEGDDGYLLVAVVEKNIDDLGGEKEVQAVTESQGLVEEISEPSSSSLSARDSSTESSSDVSIVTTGAAAADVVVGSNISSKQEQVALCEKQAPPAVVNASQVEGEEKAPAAKQAGLFGQYRDKFSKMQREAGLKPRESQPAMTRLPGSGKRKLLPSLCCTFDDSPVLKNKKQESRPEKDRTRKAQSETEAPFKLTFTRRATRRNPAGSPPSSPQRAGGPSSPEGIVKERIETYERLIGKTRTFGPLHAPSPTYKFPVPSFGKPSSPHVSGRLTIVTSNQHQQLEHEVASAEEQILATAAHLHHVERKDASKVQDRHNAPEELLHDAVSHLRHIETTNKDGQDRSSSTEPEDSSSQRISKGPLALKEAAEHCLSPVPRLTKAY